MANKEQLQKDVQTIEDQAPINEIVLFNDDVNTFEYVIDSLINVCEHTTEQAEQCTWLVHFRIGE